jgi:hypothetical protein
VTTIEGLSRVGEAATSCSGSFRRNALVLGHLAILSHPWLGKLPTRNVTSSHQEKRTSSQICKVYLHFVGLTTILWFELLNLEYAPSGADIKLIAAVVDSH